MTRRQLSWNLVVGLASGPIVAGLLLLIPLGVLTGVSVALNPSLAIDQFQPEEELIIPFLLLAGLISAANIRLAIVTSRDEKAGRVFELSTDRYAWDTSGEQNVYGHRGKQLADDLIRYLLEREGDAIDVGEVAGEDYGWGFWIGEKGFSPLWIAIAHAGRSNQDENKDDYIIAVTLEPPLTPWRRLTYKPDFALRDRMENRVVEFLASRGLSYAIEAEDWVDPEPKSQPATRF